MLHALETDVYAERLITINTEKALNFATRTDRATEMGKRV
jgi:hypothetical protein